MDALTQAAHEREPPVLQSLYGLVSEGEVPGMNDTIGQILMAMLVLAISIPATIFFWLWVKKPSVWERGP